MNKQQKERFEKWIGNHPDVWELNQHYTPHFWWVANALGDIFGWTEEYEKYIREIKNKNLVEIWRKNEKILSIKNRQI